MFVFMRSPFTSYCCQIWVTLVVVVIRYMIWASVQVASALSSLTMLYVDNFVGENIISAILESTIFIHTGDIEGDGRVRRRNKRNTGVRPGSLLPVS